MRKIFALWVNELIKISQKQVILIMIGILTIGVFGFFFIVKTQEKQFADTEQTEDDAWIYEEMRSMVSLLQDKVQLLDIQLKDAADTEKPIIEDQKAALEDQIDQYELAIEKRIPLLSGTDFRASALQRVLSLKSLLRSSLRIEESKRTDAEKQAISQVPELIRRYETLIDQQDFQAYLMFKREEIKADVSLSEGEKQIALLENELWYKVDPTGGLSKDPRFSNLQASLSRVSILRKSLLNNLDYPDSQSALPLTSSRRIKVENDLAVLVYRLEHQMATDFHNLLPEEVAVRGAIGFGNFMILLMMTILAGSTVSQEISTGSIKSLIISPTRRWKIFMAKALSLFCVSLAVTFFLYGVAMLAHGAYFGFQSGSPYVFATNKVAREMNFYVFQFANLMVNYIDLFVYMTLAYMLSITTRNTAAAVSITIAMYFGGSMANSFISLFAKGEWLKFIPFNNMGLSPDFFPFDDFAVVTGSLFGSRSTGTISPSLPFSLIYLLILVICMGWTALDSFSRRDI